MEKKVYQFTTEQNNEFTLICEDGVYDTIYHKESKLLHSEIKKVDDLSIKEKNSPNTIAWGKSPLTSQFKSAKANYPLPKSVEEGTGYGYKGDSSLPPATIPFHGYSPVKSIPFSTTLEQNDPSDDEPVGHPTEMSEECACDNEVEESYSNSHIYFFHFIDEYGNKRSGNVIATSMKEAIYKLGQSGYSNILYIKKTSEGVLVL